MRSTDRFWILCTAAIALAALLVYGASLWNGYVDWDDLQLMMANPLIRTFSPRIFISFDPELYVPLTQLSFQIEYALFGFTAFFFHLDALLLHILNAVLLCQFVFLITKQRWLAFFATLIFVMHPLNVEAVAWVSARKELLLATFFLLTLISYEKGAKGHRQW